jgi:hypothetical protein
VTARKPVLSQGHNPDQAASNSPEISCKLHRLPGHVRRTPAVRRAVVPEAADGQSADGSGSLQLPLPFLKPGVGVGVAGVDHCLLAAVPLTCPKNVGLAVGLRAKLLGVSRYFGLCVLALGLSLVGFR